MRDGWMNVDENNTIINISGFTVITTTWISVSDTGYRENTVKFGSLAINSVFLKTLTITNNYNWWTGSIKQSEAASYASVGLSLFSD